MISYTPTSTSSYSSDPAIYPSEVAECVASTPTAVPQPRGWVYGAAIFLVCVPVFIQAPLVRLFPWASLGATLVLFSLSRWLQAQGRTRLWGNLLIGFTWTWLAGSLYWGWLRWEPYLHLPVESIGLPFVAWAIARQWRSPRSNIVGDFFYLGSLLGTVVTDIYFYLVDLIPYWRKLMEVGEQSAQPIFQSAIARIQTPWGIAWAVGLATFLLVASLLPLRYQGVHWWAFSGALLSTLLVDGLFWLAASLA